MSLLARFCDVDDFCQWWAGENKIKQVRRQPRLSHSEIITLAIHFHQSGYRIFKAYYLRQVQTYLSGEFPGLVSSNRFIRLMPRVTDCLSAYLASRRGKCNGVSFIESTRRL